MPSLKMVNTLRTSDVPPAEAGTPNPSTGVKAGNWLWQINPEFNHPALIRSLEAPESFFSQRAQRLPQNPANRVSQLVRVPPPSPGFPSMIVKRYRPASFLRLLRALLRPSAAQTAFSRATYLQRLGIPTAKPIAAGSPRGLARAGESYFIAAEVIGAESLRDYYARQAGQPALKPVIRSLARIIAQLHNAAIAHTDLHLGNFLVRNTGNAAAELVLIDLDALRPLRRLTERQAQRDLLRFLHRARVHNFERLWFLGAYCRARSPRIQPKRLLRSLGPPPPEKIRPDPGEIGR